MKNVGIIVDNDLNSDIRVCKEVQILKKSGYKIHVICFGFGNKIYKEVEGIIVQRIKINKSLKDTIYALQSSLPIYEAYWERKIKKFIRLYSLDILHVHDLYMSKATFKAKQKTNKDIKIILDLHENYPYAIQSYNWTKGFIRSILTKPKSWLAKEAPYLKYATRLIVLSQEFKDELLQKHSFLKEQYIIPFPNVIDFQLFEKLKSKPIIEKSNKVTLMYFGRIAERRGIFDTLEVLEHCIENKLPVDLIIIGPIDKADKKSFFSKLSLDHFKSSITYIPWIDISDLTSYMEVCDIFLSPLKKNKQHESGVANKIFQYMFGEKPIIVSDCKPQRRLIESFNCGLSYRTNEEFYHCIEILVNNEKLRIDMGKNGKAQLYKNYNNKTYENILLNLYKEI